MENTSSTPPSAGDTLSRVTQADELASVEWEQVLGPSSLSVEADAVLRASRITFGRIDPRSSPPTKRMNTVLSRARTAFETFCRLMGHMDGAQLRIGYAPFDCELDLAGSAPGSLRLIDGTAPVRIADIWFAQSHQLRFRLEKTQQRLAGSVSLRFYQFAPRGRASEGVGAELRLLSESVVDLTELEFAHANLLNPLEPLLIVALTHDDKLLALDLLAFPSLCRGGLHSAELRTAVSSGDYLLDLQQLSDSYTASLLEHSCDDEHRSLVIEVDTRDALQSEPIFRSDVTSWLSRMFDVTIRHGPGSSRSETNAAPEAESGPAGIEEIPGPENSGELILRIPARGLPTISFLVEASGRPGDEMEMAPFLTADTVTNQPKWYVSVPPVTPWMHQIQSDVGGLDFPTRSIVGHRSSSNRPTAILYADTPTMPDQLRSFPVPPDYTQPIFAEQSFLRDTASPITVVVHSISDNTSLDRTLRSLSAQNAASRLTTILFDPSLMAVDAFGAPESISSLADLRLQLGNPDSSDERLLLFVSSFVTFHDARAVSILARMASLPRVASAGCLQIDAKLGSRNSVEFRSAGFFPDRIEFLAHPTIFFSQPNCEECLPRMTYPVAGNNMDIMMLRAATWLELTDAHDQPGNPFTPARALSYAADALRRDCVHLCTTLVSAFHGGVKSQGTFTGLPIHDALPYRELVESLKGVTIIRRL